MRFFATFITLLVGMLLSTVSSVPLKNKIAQSKRYTSAKKTIQWLLTCSSNFKSYIVSFADTVKPPVVESAKQKVRETDGTITHVFNLINGFLAIASEDAMQTISTLSEGITVEEDQVVTTGS